MKQYWLFESREQVIHFSSGQLEDYPLNTATHTYPIIASRVTLKDDKTVHGICEATITRLVKSVL